jgi:hypothetical protein
MRWSYEDRMAGLGMSPTIRRPPTSKHQRVYFSLLDHAHLQFAVKRGAHDRLPIKHKFLTDGSRDARALIFVKILILSIKVS